MIVHALKYKNLIEIKKIKDEYTQETIYSNHPIFCDCKVLSMNDDEFIKDVLFFGNQKLLEENQLIGKERLYYLAKKYNFDIELKEYQKVEQKTIREYDNNNKLIRTYYIWR